MHEKVVEHLTFSKVVELFTTIKMCKKDSSYKTDKHALITVLYFLLLKSAGHADDLHKSLCLLT